jgi:aminoglycoside phosphotransferase family enzyme
MPDDQGDAIEFLSKASSYGEAVEQVDVVETHVSLVFLAGNRAYKLKRAVKFPYLDFSTLARRRVAGTGPADSLAAAQRALGLRPAADQADG